MNISPSDLPPGRHGAVDMTHGGGGRAMAQLIEELFLGSLSRQPTPSEYDHAITFLKKGDSRAARAQDLLWALVNSKAFLFNR